MRFSDSISNIATALGKAQGELKAIQKDSVNPHFKNSYASLDTILETVRPVLAKHGLSLVQGATECYSADEGRPMAISVETMLIHSSGEWIKNSAIIPLAKADPQGAGGALTYGRRYSVAALLALATEEDDDGNTASGNPGAPVRPAPRPAAPASRPAPTPAPAAQKPAAGPQAIADVIPMVEEALGDTVEPGCPKCGGKMWDNREGKKNPKAPDFKCRDKQCDGVIWPPKPGAKAAAPARPAPAPALTSETDDDLPF